MGRTAKDRRPYVKPVEKIELSEKNTKIRFIAAAVFLAFSVFLLVRWFISFLSAESGWNTITALTSDKGDCGGEFVFQYELGRDGASAAAEGKAVQALYTDAVQKAFRLFHENELFDDTVNVRYINDHPNEEIQADRALYNAFSLLEGYNSRLLYLAPVYVRYDDLFYCNDDSGLVDFDPRISEDVRQEYAEIAKFANDPASVGIKLLDGGKIMLQVSDEYLKYAKDEGVTDFIGFYWLKNAFIADYIADTLISGGYTHGVISSYDGFTRNMDESAADYSLNLFGKRGELVYQAAMMHYSGKMTIVNYRSYPMNSLDGQRFYTPEDGITRTPYLDMSDGFCRNALSELYVYSKSKSCAQVVLETSAIFIAERLDSARLNTPDGINAVYFDGTEIKYNDKELRLSDIFDGYSYDGLREGGQGGQNADGQGG